VLQNVAQTYQTNQITTASPEELTLLLYNGAITFIKQAKLGIETKDYEKVNKYCIKVQNILCELIGTLNDTYPIAKQFRVMYDYMLRQLITANVKKDILILNEVEDFFVQFRDTWREAIAITKKNSRT
jgi:flagellar secretion chaperone FliS